MSFLTPSNIIDVAAAVQISGGEGSRKDLNGDYTLVACFDGRPIYQLRQQNATDEASDEASAPSIYLYYDEAHSSWALSSRVASVQVLAFCPDASQKPDVVRKPWYVDDDHGGHRVDTNLSVRICKWR